MSDVCENVLKAHPRRLAGFLEIDSGFGCLWRPDELAAIFKHQLSAPVPLDPANEAVGYAPALPSGPPAIRTYDELFHSPTPPIQLLKSVKEFAKANRNHPASTLPNEIAAVLYYASVLTARWRCAEVITTLNDEELRAGVSWAVAQPWVDGGIKSLLREASKALNQAR